VDAELRRRVEAWVGEDPDPETREELRKLLEVDDQAELQERFSGRLQFGTAGMRGRLGAGPQRMNRVLVRRVTAGLVAWLAAREVAGPLVVGFDARRGSHTFAEDACAVAVGAGRPAVLLPGPLPTPVLAFAVRHMGAAAGVMVTASHNPAGDNGYKVYDVEGIQIAPPADREISAAIDVVGPLAGVPLGPVPTVTGPEIEEAYLAAALSCTTSSARGIRIALTPMHGVGGRLAVDVLHRAGFDDVHVVAAQADPDPGFPTVDFPNPEEPGALDLLLDLARGVRADAAFALDPDADRFSAAIPDPDRERPWRVLTGDEVGALLGWWLLEHTGGGDRVVATTIVSSSLLGKMAAAAGVAYRETLTGFKWLARTPEPGQRLVYAYEEALGHCAGPAVRDKDGMTAALVFAEMTATLAAQGRTPLDALAELDARFGAHATGAVSVRTAAGLGQLARLRRHPPSELAGLPIVEVVDLAEGWKGLPPTDGLRLALAGDGGRVVIRPSGTEPKLKSYVEVVAPTRTAANARLALLVESLRVLLGDGGERMRR
jgi:phosphomannomutase